MLKVMISEEHRSGERTYAVLSTYEATRFMIADGKQSLTSWNNLESA